MPEGSRRLVARLAVVALAAASLTALAAPAASGGVPNPGVFEVPEGATATFFHPYLIGCNALEWGYEITGENSVVVDQGGGTCGGQSFDDLVIGPFDDDITFRVFLKDDSCDTTYYSDGTSDAGQVDHATVSGTGPWLVQIADSNADCTDEFDDRTGANLDVVVAINPVLTVEKVVDGDDPGVAFPITVECEAHGDVPGAVGTAVDSRIGLDGPGDSDLAVVELEDGESADIPIGLDSPYIDSVDCTVEESLDDVDLPTGWECDDPSIDHPEVTWEEGEWSHSTVVVTNTCTEPEPTPAPTPAPAPAPAPAAAVVAPTFTG